jgi:hypothetical protein
MDTAGIDGAGPLFRAMHDLRGGGDGSSSLDRARPSAMAAGNGARGPLRPYSNQHRPARKVLHPLPLELRGRRRTKHRERLFGECSFARSLAIPAQSDWAIRRLGSGAPSRNAHHRALRSRPPHEGSARRDRHAARGSANAEQCESTGSLWGKFRDPADHRTNHTAAIPSAKRGLGALQIPDNLVFPPSSRLPLERTLLSLKHSTIGVVNVEAKGFIFIVEQSQLMEKNLWPVVLGS